MNAVIDTEKLVKRPSNKEVSRAGEIIRTSTDDQKVFEAISVLDNWRSLHSTPLNAMRKYVMGVLKRKKFSAIIGQRLKRMPSIITKIKRFEGMSASRMQDIGGIRIILDSISDVYAVHTAITNSKTKHEFFVPPKDYIKEPKKDGYRSLHVFIYHNEKHLEYDGMRIEVQLRTKLQHSWATAVETLGAINNASYKTGEGGEEEKRFFKLASALLALKEGQNVAAEFIDTPKQELIKELMTLDKKLNIISSISGISVSSEKISKYIAKGCKYFVLELTITEGNKGQLTLTSFHLEDDARLFYKAKEDATRSLGNKSVLMITSENIKNIKKAYPNYFLDTQYFVKELRKIIESKIS